MRSFRQLTVEKRRSIYIGFLTGEPKTSIARRIGVDRSTVGYHVSKIRNLPEQRIIALIAPESACGHSALKCLTCGTAHDNLMSEELQEIRRLRAALGDAEKRLATLDETTPRDSRIYPRPAFLSVRL